MQKLKVNLASFGGDSITDADRRKAEKAVEKLRVIVNDEVFRRRVATFDYTDIRVTDLAGNVRELPREDVLPRILTGGELLDPAQDNEMDLRIYVDRNCKNEVGHSSPTKSLTIWTKARAFHRSSALGMAAHWAHEWTHLCGFIHDGDDTPRRPRSVPYAFGDLIIEVGRSLDLDD